MRNLFLLILLVCIGLNTFGQSFNASFKDGIHMRITVISRTAEGAHKLRIMTPLAPLFMEPGYAGVGNVSWYEPNKFLLEANYGYGGQSIRSLFYFAKSITTSKVNVAVKGRYNGGNTYTIYRIEVPDMPVQKSFGVHTGIDRRNYGGVFTDLNLKTIELTTGVGFSKIKNWQLTEEDSTISKPHKLSHCSIFSLYGDLAFALYRKFTANPYEPEQKEKTLSDVSSIVGFRIYLEGYAPLGYNTNTDAGLKYLLGVELNCAKEIYPLVGLVLYFGFIRNKNVP